MCSSEMKCVIEDALKILGFPELPELFQARQIGDGIWRAIFCFTVQNVCFCQHIDLEISENLSRDHILDLWMEAIFLKRDIWLQELVCDRPSSRNLTASKF